jgi:hypothetical protein
MRKRFTSFALLCATLFTISCKRDLKSHPLAPGEREEIAHQIPDRDLSLDPPHTSDIDISPLQNPTDDANAIIRIKFTEPHLPSSLKIILDERVVTVHDDGRNRDEKAGDGIFTGLAKIDFSDIDRNTQRIEQFLKRDNRALNQPVFQNRQLVDTVPIQLLHLGSDGLHVRFPLAGLGNAAASNQSLLITDGSVVRDPARTYNGCDATGSMGKWTFGYLMTQMANQSSTGTDPSTFVSNWLQTWMNDQPVNGFTAEQRTEINSEVIQPWINRSGGPGSPLNLSLAPFRLLAIVNRLDLRSNSVYGGGDAGEARFVFGVMQSFNCTPLLFNVILEYGIPKAGCQAVRSWAQQWENLSTIPLGTPAYNNALEAITDQFTSAGANPRKPGGSALNQLRTDEIALSTSWELREFHLVPAAGSQVQLLPAVVKQTPESAPLNNSISLGDYVNSLPLAELQNNTFVVPLQWQNRPFLGASSINHQDIWDAPNIPAATADPDARHLFAINTCNGCHGHETATVNFVQISNNFPAGLSGFLTGETIPDPLAPSITRTFNDLQRRATDLDAAANQACMTTLGQRPLLFTH